MKAPSERELHRIERELKRAPRGAQRAVGGGIYMRLDAGGRRRFQFLKRRDGGGQPGGTYDSWQDAIDALAIRQAAAAAPEDGVGGPSAVAILDWEVSRYVDEAWWPDVTLHLDVLTQLDYSRGWNDLKPHLDGVTLRQLQDSPLLIDRVKRNIAAEKTYARKPGEEPKLHKAAADKPLKVLSIICSHATDRNVLVRNPMAGVRRFNRRRSAAGSKDAPSHRPILPSEVKLPHTAALAGSGMRGDPLNLLRDRLVPELIVTGLRPSDILGMRNRCWRDQHSPLSRIHIDSAVKNLKGYLLEGEPKTGARDLHLFDAIAEQLEAIYQLAGCPGLDELTFPNARGGLLQWGNWRKNVWYPALHRAGIAQGPNADADGAFYPYILRHVGVTLMGHAQRPEGGTYARDETAAQFGHTAATLDRVYLRIPDDMHGIGGHTMDEILRNARRHVWGPIPGDPDYHEVEYDLLQAAELTGISNTALAARIQRGSIPGVKRGGKYYVTHFNLAWHGLVARTRS